jgi:hypothetical protein
LLAKEQRKHGLHLTTNAFLLRFETAAVGGTGKVGDVITYTLL